MFVVTCWRSNGMFVSNLQAYVFSRCILRLCAQGLSLKCETRMSKVIWPQDALPIHRLFCIAPTLHSGPTLVSLESVPSIRWMWNPVPLIIIRLVILHIIFLHVSGSNNPTGISTSSDRSRFHYYYTTKDFIGFFLMLPIFIVITMLMPTILIDPENYIEANILITPTHVQPEWYFLWLYAILRSNTQLLEPMLVCPPNSMFISWDVFAQLTHVPNAQTNTQQTMLHRTCGVKGHNVQRMGDVAYKWCITAFVNGVCSACLNFDVLVCCYLHQ